jgi:hypothetical protein
MKNELIRISLGAANERHEARKTAHAGFLTSPRSCWLRDFYLMFKINDLGTGTFVYYLIYNATSK